MVTIANPIGAGLTVGIGSTAIASASITSGIVTSISITGVGAGYSSFLPPSILSLIHI